MFMVIMDSGSNMHWNSMVQMTFIRDKYLSDKSLTILDIGSCNVHRNRKSTYRVVFDGYDYTGMDIVAGKNVDIVGYENITRIYDVVISGQVMEHVKRPWEWLRSILQYTKKYIVIIVPNTLQEHRFPIDTYRYFPDGMRDLFEYAEIKEIEIYKSEGDTVGIGEKC